MGILFQFIKYKAMTREEAKELLPIIQAFAEGKMIQDKIEGQTDWVDTDEINLEYNGQKIKHRIKPEQKYRPFKTQEECWEEMHKHPDVGWLKSKNTGSIGLIGSLYTKDEVLMIIWATNEYNKYTSFDVFKDYVFIDGTPFGIKE